jgi:hypothetical protein
VAADEELVADPVTVRTPVFVRRDAEDPEADILAVLAVVVMI